MENMHRGYHDKVESMDYGLDYIIHQSVEYGVSWMDPEFMPITQVILYSCIVAPLSPFIRD
jgi:hypothetical protein